MPTAVPNKPWDRLCTWNAAPIGSLADSRQLDNASFDLQRATAFAAVTLQRDAFTT